VLQGMPTLVAALAHHAEEVTVTTAAWDAPGPSPNFNNARDILPKRLCRGQGAVLSVFRPFDRRPSSPFALIY
jgi:hypothetical protein